ncbi:MAG: glycosyl hydrolase family 18 protein [Candidatus Dormibacteraceae bacterium]
MIGSKGHRIVASALLVVGVTWIQSTVVFAAPNQLPQEPPIMQVAAQQLDGPPPTNLSPRAAISPIHKMTPNTLQRQVFGFVNGGALSASGIGYTSWDLSQLSTIAFFGLPVNPDSGEFTHNAGWNIWHSALASSFINAAHAHGVKVELSLIYQNNGQSMCTALDHSQTTIDQAAAERLGADGFNLDYEGLNQHCPDGTSTRDKLTHFVQQLRSRQLGSLTIDTYASSAEDGAGFFDIGNLARSVDSLVVMAYGMEISNGPCAKCLGPTSPLDAGNSGAYRWNFTRTTNVYRPWASQTILALPWYGVKGCGPANAGANAAISGSSGADPYRTIATYSSDAKIKSWSGIHRDLAGDEPWATYFSAYSNCWREEYWDDATSLGQKEGLIKQGGFQGVGIFALDYGGGDPSLWQALRSYAG